jgi:hypothetical protein
MPSRFYRGMSKLPILFPARVASSLHLLAHYRIPYNPVWFVGCLENISCSGVLFRPDNCDFESVTTLDLRLEIPPSKKEAGVQAEIVGKGGVVRVERGCPTEISLAVAVAIHHCRVMQKQAPE